MSYSLLNSKMKEVEKTIKKPPPKRRSVDERPSDMDSDIIEIKPDGSEPITSLSEMDPDEPDRSLGDFYCKLCDSHMNSEAMWESHVTGKRHLRNVKKGDPDPKYEELDADSSIKHELRNVRDPIIGLNYIHEIRRREPGVQPLYNCFLCCSNLVTVPLVIEHVIGTKHRLNFIRENNPKEYQLIDSAKLTRSQLEPLLTEKAALLEAEYGRGSVKVKLEKNKPSASYKRERDYDIKEIPAKPSKLPKFDDTSKPSSLKTKDFKPRDKSHYQHDDRFENDRSAFSRTEQEKSDVDNHKSYSKPSYKDNDRYQDRSFQVSSSTRSDRIDRSHQTSGSSARNDDRYQDHLKQASASSARNNDRYQDHLKHASASSARDDDRYLDHFKQASSSSARNDRYQDHLKQASSSSARNDDYKFYDKYKPGESSSRYDSQSYESTRSRVAEYASKQYASESFTKQHSSQSQYRVEAPPSTSSTNLSSPNSILREFVSQLLGLSKEYFLKICLMKLQDIKNEELKKEELNVLLEIYSLSQKMIHQSLPPQIREMLKLKLQDSLQPKPVVQESPSISQITMDDISSLLSKLRQANSQPQQATENYPAPTNASQAVKENMTMNLVDVSRLFPQMSVPPIQTSNLSSNFPAIGNLQPPRPQTNQPPNFQPMRNMPPVVPMNAAFGTSIASTPSSIPGLGMPEENRPYSNPSWKNNQYPNFRNY